MKTIKAFSIPELLVVMIVTGVICCAVFDGLLLIGKLWKNTDSLILDDMDSLNIYYRDNTWLVPGETITEQNDTLDTFLANEIWHMRLINEKDVIYDW